MSTVDNITCPVCDAEIPSDSNKCPVCGVDLGLFDLKDTEIGEIESDESLDELFDLMHEEMDDEEFIEKIKNFGVETNGEGLEEPVVDNISETVPDKDIIIFECPICGEDVAEEETVCPGCGAVFEEEDYGEKTEEALFIARKSLAEVRELNMGLPALKNLLKTAVDAKKKEDYEECLEVVDEIQSSVDTIKDIREIMETGKNKVRQIKNKGLDFKPYLKDLKSAKKMVDQGSYEEALSKLNSTIDNLDEILTGESKKAMKEELKEDLDVLLVEIRSALSKHLETSLDISNLKTLVKKAVKARRNEEYRRGIELAHEALKASEKMLRFSSLLEKSKNRLRSMKENNMDSKAHLKDIKDAKKGVEKGYIEDSINKISSMIERMDDEIESYLDEKKRKKSEVQTLLEPKLQEADRTIEDLKEAKFSIEPILNLRSEIDEDVDKEDYDEVLEKADRLLYLSGNALRAKILYEENRSRLQELKEGGEDVKELLESVKEGRKKADEGEYQEALKHFEENIEKLEVALVELEKKEKEKLSIKNVEEMVSEMRSLLMIARKKGIKVKGGKDIIEEAVESTAAKDFEHTLSLLEEGREQIVETIIDKIDEKIVSLELTIEEAGGVPEVEEHLQGVKEGIQSEDYKTALEKISSAEDAMEEFGEPAVGTTDFVSETEEMIDEAEKLGFDISESKEIISKAKMDLIDGNEDIAIGKTDDAIDTILEQVPSQFKSFVKGAQNDLKKAKISGMDISDSIMLLKQASFAREEENFEKCFEYMNKYQRVMREKWE